MRGSPLIGREGELAVLSALVDGAAERGGALVLRGPAGIGKSVLLHAGMERARGRAMLVLSTTGTQMEARLPFAGLHQLLRPVLGQAERLPTPQRSALLAAFGMTDSAAPDMFLVALATLELLSDAASDVPVLAMVEDAHWLDRPSAEALAFVARRLQFDPIVLLLALRDGAPSALDEAGLPELAVPSLPPAAAATLLDAHAPDLADPVRARILDEAEGNPLALVELPAAIAADHGDPGVPLPARLPLTARLESAFAARQADLPAATRRILLVGAANDGGAVSDVLRGASIADGTERTLADFAPAVAAGLVDVRSMRLQCRHPLVRSAIYAAASDSERQEAHRALAEVFVDQPDRRVWHLAAATTGPDEFIARELEFAADRACRRGGALAAVTALERAAQLSPDQTRRGSRLLQASEIAFELGRRDTVRRLLAEAEGLPLDAAQRTQAAWLREIFDDGLQGSASGIHLLVDDAARVADSDPGLALKLLTGAGLRCWWADLGPDVRLRVVAAAQRVPVDPDDPRLVSVLAWADPDGQGSLVHNALQRVARGGTYDPSSARLYGLAAMAIGAHDTAGPLLSTAVDGLRSEGRIGLLAHSLIARAKSNLHRGDLRSALADVSEGSRLANETSQQFWATGSLGAVSMVAGLRGDESRAAALAGEAEATALPSRASAVLSDVQLARGVTALACGRPEEAFGELRRMFDPRDPAHHYMKTRWAIGDLAEAARHSGQIDEVRPLFEALDQTDSPSPRSRLAILHARPLLADDHAAETAFKAALAADLRPWPLTRGRIHLAYGEWLRRQRRSSDARGPLRVARDTFDALGAVAWSERTRAELRAAGERSNVRTPEARDHLTPQELQIAEMAAEGLSNREIGQRLYLSHRTVGSHLYRIFPKLGVSSRHELRTALETGSVDPQSRD
ncbi:LuxR family transcriptional regulator [Sporichthya brevicatena]|uniref:LuxR family transcriptional regulator n=1 Tax=Sporichthya brevicatena TaxID=171442 RepID=A0ABP3S2T4_9ACTN